MSSKKSTYTITPTLEVHVTSEDIDDIMAAAMDSITYWCCKAKVVGDYNWLNEYASDQISRGNSLILYDAESNDKWELTLDKFLNGLKLAIEQGIGISINVADGSIDTAEIDGAYADAIVQLALFGEVVFG